MIHNRLKKELSAESR